MDIAKIVLNPVRMRIIQHVIVHKEVIVSDLADVMSDVPKTTLYRHINMLEKAGLIDVIKESRIRGTLEKTYGLGRSYTEHMNENTNKMPATFLMSLLADFETYFEKEDADPQRDMLFLGTATFNLSDEEYIELVTEMGSVISKYLDKEMTPERKVRRFSNISSPYNQM